MRAGVEGAQSMAQAMQDIVENSFGVSRSGPVVRPARACTILATPAARYLG